MESTLKICSYICSLRFSIPYFSDYLSAFSKILMDEIHFYLSCRKSHRYDNVFYSVFKEGKQDKQKYKQSFGRHKISWDLEFT